MILAPKVDGLWITLLLYASEGCERLHYCAANSVMLQYLREWKNTTNGDTV